MARDLRSWLNERIGHTAITGGHGTDIAATQSKLVEAAQLARFSFVHFAGELLARRRSGDTAWCQTICFNASKMSKGSRTHLPTESGVLPAALCRLPKIGAVGRITISCLLACYGERNVTQVGCGTFGRASCGSKVIEVATPFPAKFTTASRRPRKPQSLVSNSSDVITTASR